MKTEMTEKERELRTKDVEEFSENKELVVSIASLFKAMSDPTRVRILYALSKGPLCVTEISHMLGMSQSSISHQLATLRERKIIKVERISRKAIYSLDDEHVLCIFKDGYDHAKHRPVND